ncbi:MAG: SAVED domain-containing protein [Thermomicrobiales bacterium]
MGGAWDGFLNVVTNIANVLAILSFAVWLFSAHQFWKQKKEYEKRLGFIGQRVGGRPIALAVGLGGSIRGQVEAYLADEETDILVEEIVHEGFVPHEEFPNVLQQVRDHKAEFTRVGVTDLHLFYKGPVSLAVAIGAILNNWAPTTVYNQIEHPTTGLLTYRKDVVISRGTSVGMPRQ